MTPRPDVSAERTAQIVEAAIAVFSRLGFHKARMDDIAREAGVSKGTLYWYFESKDAIKEALLQHLFEQEVQEVTTVLAAEGSVSERLLALTQQLAGRLEEQEKLIPIIHEFYATATRDPTVQRTLAGYIRAYRELLGAHIQLGIERGEFHLPDAEAAATIIGSIVEGLALLWMIDPQTVRWRDTFPLAMQLLLAGMRADRKE